MSKIGTILSHFSVLRLPLCMMGGRRCCFYDNRLDFYAGRFGVKEGKYGNTVKKCIFLGLLFND